MSVIWVEAIDPQERRGSETENYSREDRVSETDKTSGDAQSEMGVVRGSTDD